MYVFALMSTLFRQLRVVPSSQLLYNYIALLAMKNKDMPLTK